MMDFLFRVASSLNAPLFVGPLVLNRRLLLVILSIAAGILVQRLLFPRDREVADRSLTVWLVGIAAWRLFPALIAWESVVRDPALILVLPAGRPALLAGIAAGALAAGWSILRAGRSERRRAASAIGRNLALTLACALPVAVLLASLPVPRWPGERIGILLSRFARFG